MAIHNVEIAKIFNKLADYLEIKGENPFRIRAYRNAALTIGSLPKNVTDMLAAGEDLTDLPGIGKDLAGKIEVIVKTGELPLLTRIEKRMPQVLIELMQIEGLGPKRVYVLYKRLHLKTLQDLERAINKGKITKIKGFGKKTEAMIRAGIKGLGAEEKPIRLADATIIAKALEVFLKKIPEVKDIEIAGSYRRHKDTIADLDIIIAAKKAAPIISQFVKYDEVAAVTSKGTTRSSVQLHSGMRVDLRVVPEKSYGAALLYFTGSKNHNITLRKMAVKKKLKLNEYGVFKGRKSIAGKTEAEIYQLFNLPYIEPELREDRGEFVIAREKQLPKLITLKDIRGDLHCHTKATDGTATLEAMVKAAEEKGYEYIAITEHSKHLSVASGFHKKDLLEQIKIIDRLNEKLKNIVILKSIEVDILEDGKLDLPDDVLKLLDLTVCAVHYKFKLSRKQQTERILQAMDNPYFNILAHPTGRLINRRSAYEVDLERIMRAAKEHGCILELNAQPERADLSDIDCKMAKDMGVKLSISTDAHSIQQLSYMQYGVYQARRGWLEAGDVINTRKLSELRKLLKRI